jgi:DNA repair exonuclease SbcCD ATPase subunit
MQLLRLEVKNWCQHKSRVCNFTRGLVAIIGKIGSGKSNLLGAICWLLTGENPNNGLKAENVAQLSGADEAAYATLEFEHAGHIVVVTRHLLPEKEQATLFVDDVEAARGDKAVTAYIERLLGIDSKFISRFVIVAQNEIFSFIEDGATDVDKFFQKLFGTATAEKCQDIIGKQLNKLVIPEIIQPSAQLIPSLTDMDTQLGALSVKTAKLPSLETFLAASASQQSILNDWRSKQTLRADLDAAEKKIIEYSSNLERVKKDGQQYEDDLIALKDAITGNKDTHSAAKVALGHLATYKQIAKTRAANKARLAEIAELRANTPEPALVQAAVIERAINDGKEVELKLQQAKLFIAAFAADGVAECPTCHTPTKNIAPALADAEQNIPAFSAQFELCKQSLAELITQREFRLAWEKQEAQLAVEESQLLSAVKSFAAIDVPDAEEAELVKIVSDHDKLHAAYLELEPLAQKAREKCAAYQGGLEAAIAQKDQLAAAFNKLAVTETDANIAQTTIDVLSAQCVTRQELETQKTQLTFERENLRDKIAQIQADEDKAKNYRVWAEIATTTRDALKAAPRLVAKRNLQRLEIAINELLQVFGVDFFIRAASDDTPTFIAEFFDGRKQPAKRLSYGQKTVLALAFRVAVNALFADAIGLLALDEPTAYLDQQRIKALAPVLEKLRELSTARGLQCLLVTHETSLAHLFESAVELDA